MRRLMSTGIASLVAAFALTVTPTPVAAECTYVPDWPPASKAIQSARAVIVGEVVTEFDRAELDVTIEGPRDRALRVTEVVRGDYAVGDLIDIQYLKPNWPWGGSSETGPYPSCREGGPTARRGEVLVLALGAVQPRQRLRTYGYSWVQPPTIYNAVGLVDSGQRHYTNLREFITIQEIRRLGALPQTDVAPGAPPAGPADSMIPFVLVFLAGLVGGAVAYRRLGSGPSGR